jgi:hypothetical protein
MAEVADATTAGEILIIAVILSVFPKVVVRWRRWRLGDEGEKRCSVLYSRTELNQAEKISHASRDIYTFSIGSQQAIHRA